MLANSANRRHANSMPIGGHDFWRKMQMVSRITCTAADDALSVGEKDDIEQHGGRIGRRTVGVDAKPGVEAAQVDLVIEQLD